MNVGGAIIPTAVSVYLIVHDYIWQHSLIAMACVAVVVFLVALPVEWHRHTISRASGCRRRRRHRQARRSRPRLHVRHARHARRRGPDEPVACPAPRCAGGINPRRRHFRRCLPLRPSRRPARESLTRAVIESRSGQIADDVEVIWTPAAPMSLPMLNPAEQGEPGAGGWGCARGPNLRANSPPLLSSRPALAANCPQVRRPFCGPTAARDCSHDISKCATVRHQRGGCDGLAIWLVDAAHGRPA